MAIWPRAIVRAAMARFRRAKLDTQSWHALLLDSSALETMVLKPLGSGGAAPHREWPRRPNRTTCAHDWIPAAPIRKLASHARRLAAMRLPS